MNEELTVEKCGKDFLNNIVLKLVFSRFVILKGKDKKIKEELFKKLMSLRSEFVYINGKEINADAMRKLIKENHDKIYLIDEAESISNDYYVKKDLIDNDIRFILSLENHLVPEKDFQDIMYTIVNI